MSVPRDDLVDDWQQAALAGARELRRGDPSSALGGWVAASSAVRGGLVTRGCSRRRAPSRGAGALLFLYLRQCQPGAHCDYVQDGMRWIGRQGQRVNLFPSADANVRRVAIRALLGQFQAPLFSALKLFVSQAVGVRLDEFTRVG
jgi:hypothetical protein